MAVNRTNYRQHYIPTSYRRAGAMPSAGAAVAGRGRNPHDPLPTSTIKVIYQNVNGWASKAKLLRQTYSAIDTDVILLADTSLQNDDKMKFHPYTSYQHSSTGGRYAGVGIFIKGNIQHTLVNRKFKHDTIAV